MKEQVLTAGKGVSTRWVARRQLWLSQAKWRSEDRKPVVVLRRFSGALTPIGAGGRKPLHRHRGRAGAQNDLRATLDARCGHGGAVRGAVRGKQGRGGSKPGPPPSS